jgi:hypothetical protein
MTIRTNRQVHIPGSKILGAVMAITAVTSAGGCEGGDLLQPPGSETTETESSAQALVWSNVASAPYAAGSPSVANDSGSTRATGAMSAESRAVYWEDHSNAWLESSFTMPAFVDGATVEAQIDVTSGYATTGAHWPFGWGNAGVAISLHVRSAAGLLCETEIKLADENAGTKPVAVGLQRLKCGYVGIVPAGAITAQVRVRTWAFAMGDAWSDARVTATLRSITATKDSGAEDAGDVVISDSITGISFKMDDSFGLGGDQFEIGRVLFTAVSDPALALLAINRTSGDVRVGTIVGETLSPAGGRSFSGGVDMCGTGRTCLVADVQGRDRVDEIVAFDQRDGKVRRFRSNGSTGFALAGEQDTMGWCGSPFRCQLADVDNDQAADVIRLGSGTVDVARNDRFGSFAFSRPGGPSLPPWHLGFCLRGERCALGDLNNDGRADLIAFDAAGDVWTALSTGSAFGPRRLARAGWCPPGADCQVADVDGDGRADVARFWHLSFVQIALSDGSGAFPHSIGRSSECWETRVCRAAPVMRRPGVVAGKQRADFVSITP